MSNFQRVEEQEFSMDEVVLYTHSGVFHGDDVFAVAIVQEFFGGAGVPIERVRELPEEFEAPDIAVDVGGEHDWSKIIFDHHQKGGSDDGMAACGKTWAFFGPEICDGSEEVAARVYEVLLGSIDRADIAVSDWTPVSDSMRHLSGAALISSMNPPVGASAEEQMECFQIAVNAARTALKGTVSQAKAWVTMRTAVAEAAEIRPRPEVLVLEKPGPWQEHVFELGLDDVLYAIFPDLSRGGYRLQAVPDAPGSFGMRRPLPVAWKGLRGADFNAALGGEFTEDSSLFCHPGLFMAGAASLEEVLKMAELAL